MNKMLTLINIEFKRNMRHFIPFVSIFFILNIALNMFHMYRHYLRVDVIKSFMERNGGLTYGMSILNNDFKIVILVYAGMFVIIGYILHIWMRDISHKSKSICTYFMLPIKNTYIYIGKFISVLTMIYAYVLSHILALQISKFIFNIVFKDMVIKSSLASDLIYNQPLRAIIPIDIYDFFMNHMLIIPLIISVMFLTTMIGIFMNRTKGYYIFMAIFIIGLYIYPEILGDVAIFIVDEIYLLSPINVMVGLLITNMISLYIFNKRYIVE